MCMLDVTTVCPKCGTQETHAIANPNLSFMRMVVCKNCNLSYDVLGNIATIDSANSTLTESGIIIVQRWTILGLAVPRKLPFYKPINKNKVV